MTVTCSAGRLALGEPLAGSAPFARLWVMLEQPGPWGHDAVRESHLDASVGDALAALPAGRPVRIGVIRSVGAHADTTHGARTLLIARTDPGASWLISRRIHDVSTLAESLDLDALLASASDPSNLPGEPLRSPDRALLVCTNAKRDQCCAVLGRPLAATLAQRAASGEAVEVWETSHTSGHRFAPTYVSLPDGYLFGGPDAERASVEACRGRSSLEPTAQVAELAVLGGLGAATPRPLEVDRLGAANTYRVHDPESNASYEVALNPTSGPDRPESCGKAAVPSKWFTATVTAAV